MKFAKVLLLSLVSFMSCSDDDEATPFDKADGVIGGMLYNTFWDPATGFNQTDTSVINKLKKYPDFFKCKQCHAWDLEGNTASYIGRGPNKNRPRVGVPLRTTILAKTPEQLFAIIKNGATANTRRPFSFDPSTYDPAANFVEGDKMPDYSTLLTDAQIWDLVKFLKHEAFDVTKLYDATITGTYPTGKIVYSNIGKGGNAQNGLKIWQQGDCSTAACHGQSGTAVLVDNATFTIGGFIKAKPNEAQHKIRFGQLENSGMNPHKLTIQEMADLYLALSDTTGFPLRK